MVEMTGLCFMLIEYKLYPETDISDSIRNCNIKDEMKQHHYKTLVLHSLSAQLQTIMRNFKCSVIFAWSAQSDCIRISDLSNAYYDVKCSC